MWMATDQAEENDRAESVALEWETLGCMVRVFTFQAVALHFASVGTACDQCENDAPVGGPMGSDRGSAREPSQE